ncbi:hypothetical protein B7494_g7698 [Chlorociboria aeruginascens]|nr:hypothetical protein B7494_g7698 [Chlorociboria aeruginascens]
MDDPWGSPWADESPSQTTPHQKDERVVSFSTPVRGSELALAGKTNTPWSEDNNTENELGDWAAFPVEERGRQLGFDGTADGWNNEGLEVRKEDATRASGSWKDDEEHKVVDVLKLKPSLLANPPEGSRQVSPDPWAPEFRSDVHDEQELEVEICPVEEIKEESTIHPSIPNTSHPLEPNGDLVETQGLENQPKEEQPPPESIEISEQSTNHQDYVSSRPSSSPSDHSHHNDSTAESPRTSLDDEPRRPQMERKVSAKVKYLVEHFDGLAKHDSRESSRTRSDTRGSENGTTNVDEEDGFGDFGEFEEGGSEVGNELEDVSFEKTPIAPVAPLTSESELGKLANIPKKDPGPLEFRIDTSLIDDLFSSGVDKDVHGPPAEKAFIPDRIINDSFSSLEQRKTWYRISRYGTMRKYNSGDDENYVRINWIRSQVRAETLKIVARWMEEDRISGRVVLGGSSKGSSLFGWSDRKTPVDISAAFAAKEVKRNSICKTPGDVAEVPREPESPTSGSTNEIKLMPQPTAQFGWSMASPLPQEKVQIPIQMKPAPERSSEPAVSIGNTQSPSRQSMQNGLHSLKPIPQRPAAPIKPILPPSIPKISTSFSSNPVIATEEDDWGEMVSSPVVAASTLALPRGLRHKKSRSLGQPTAFAQSPFTSQSQISPSRGHISRMSFDDILIPEVNNPWSPTPTPLSTKAIAINPDSYSPFFNDDTPTPRAPNPPPAFNTRTPNSSIDAWASVDFSIFDTPSAPPPSRPQQPKAPLPKPAAFTPPPISPPQSQKAREKIEQDRTVQSIIKGLPDLSFMLRR